MVKSIIESPFFYQRLDKCNTNWQEKLFLLQKLKLKLLKKTLLLLLVLV